MAIAAILAIFWTENMNKTELTERRLSLLEQIAEAADEISRIDIELQKSITGDYDRYD